MRRSRVSARTSWQCSRLRASGAPWWPARSSFAPATPSSDFFVVLRGRVAVIDGFGSPAERVIGVHGDRRFVGELNLVTGQPAFLTAVVREPGEAIVLSRDELQAVVLGQSAARRRDRQCVHRPARAPDRARHGPAAHRVAPRAGQPPPSRVPDTQSDPAQVPGPRDRLAGRSAAAMAVDRSARDAAPAARVACAEEPEQPRGRRGAEPQNRDRLRGPVRPRGGRRRSGWARDGGLRGVGGPEHGARRLGRDRRAGEHVVADRELPRLSGRHLGLGSRRARRRAGVAFRCAPRRPRDGERALVRRRPPRRRARRRRAPARSHRRARHRRELPPPRRREPRRVRRRRRLLRGHAGGGADVRRQPRRSRRWRQLRRTGRGVPRAARQPGGSRRARR